MGARAKTLSVVGVLGTRHKSSRFFDRLIPEDDPATKEFKERERRIIKEQMQRGKLADALKAKSEKVCNMVSNYLCPGHFERG